MKLLFDLNSLRPPRSGVGYYTQHLLEGLRDEPDVQGLAGWVGTECFEGERLLALINQRVPLRRGVQFTEGIAAKVLQKARSMPGLYRGRTIVRAIKSREVRDHFARRGYVYHETNFVASRYKGPTVVTIHDLSHRRHPEFHPRVAVEYLDRELPKTLRQAQVVIADSHYTKNDIVDIYGVPESKVVTVHLGVEAAFQPYSGESCAEALADLGLKHRGFVLSVCTLQPRKNLQRLVEAFARLPAEMRSAFPLVLIGADGWNNSALMRVIEPLARDGQVVAPGYVPRENLLKLFASAALFAYPSLFEGFGLPVAEAMASGVAVLTSNLTSLPEVSAGAAWEVDPYSIDDIAAGMERLLGDPALRDELIAKGLRRAADLTWDATVAQTCAVYRGLSA
jgi:glycosyltransferase involved in cell wall biosynthesis